MSLSQEQITIAVTVYSRRHYLKQAISSALNQTKPVRVLVVEDCGPDPEMESFVKGEFGSAIQYFRSQKRRGIFGNWNVCLDLCETEWISILHDDDYLASNFVESMIELARLAPGCGLYFGWTHLVNELGNPLPTVLHHVYKAMVDGKGNPLSGAEPWRNTGRWKPIDLGAVLYATAFQFPGQLFPVQLAKKLGGFRETSYFCGDWEMWANLIADSGGAQTAEYVAFNRCHAGWDRGCTQIVATGRLLPTTIMQHKRVLALMRRSKPIEFDRSIYTRGLPVSVRFLVQYGPLLPRYLFNYQLKMFLLSRPPHWRYAFIQQCVRIGGAGFIHLASKLWSRRNSSVSQ